MKKIATRVLYVFSFSLLFVALYLNIAGKEQVEASFLKAESKAGESNVNLSQSNAVAQPENHVVLK